MSEPILDPNYWKSRLDQAAEEHHAIFCAPGGMWKAIEDRHKQILQETIHPQHSILDVGCGWGRLLDLMSPWFVGQYLGVDLSPDFIAKARERYPARKFLVRDVLSCGGIEPEESGRCYKFEWAICISIRPMVINNLGETEWESMKEWISWHARRLLLLEYNVHHKGDIITWD